MARRGAAGIGDRLATGEGRGRGRRLTSGLAAALAAVIAAEPTVAADFESVFAASDAPTANHPARWSPWVELGGTWASDHSSYGEFTVFAPLWQDPDSLVFTDFRGKVFESSLIEGNFALGLRQMTEFGFNLGAWGALDVRKTAHDNVFGQVSGGLELLSEYFDARINGYLPFTGPQAAPGMADVVLDGNNIFMIGAQEVALAGVDAEVGARLPFAGNAGSLGVYGGGFWFDNSHAAEAVAGGKLRAELAFNDVLGAGSQFSAQYAFTHDNVRGDRHLVGARLRIPLGPAPAASAVPAQWLRMTDRVERDVDIVIGQSGEEAVEDALTGTDFDRVAYVEGGGSIRVASEGAGANSLIIANGTISGSHELNGDQTLLGGDRTIAVRGRTTGTLANFTAPGAAATLDGPGGTPNLTLLGSNTHVAGLTIEGEGEDELATNNVGIRGGSGKSNIAITGTTVTATTSFGILFDDNNSNVTIADVIITDAGGDGILFGSDNSDVAIAGVTIQQPGTSGIAFIDRNVGVSISGADISSTVENGIFFNEDNENVTISGTTITDAGVHGIFANADNDNVSISGTTITNPGNVGIAFSGGNNVTISDTAIIDAGFVGIYLFISNTVALNSSVLAGTFGDNGIQIDDSGNTLSGGGNTAAGATFGNVVPGGTFCESGVQTGSIAFVDDGTGNPATCP